MIFAIFRVAISALTPTMITIPKMLNLDRDAIAPPLQRRH
jgi:hypothetical protein